MENAEQEQRFTVNAAQGKVLEQGLQCETLPLGKALLFSSHPSGYEHLCHHYTHFQ